LYCYNSKVYFSELKYTYTESSAAYGVLALMCDIGGALGLILGSTVLTFFEVGDLILTLIMTSIDRKVKDKAAKSRRASAAAVASTITIQDA
jgi:Amiloride-sensitive sodium channel